MDKQSPQTISIRLRLFPWAAACATLAVGLFLTVKVADIDSSRRLNDAKSQTISDLAVIRARLEAVAHSAFSSTSGLVNVIGHQGAITPELFNAMAAQAIKTAPQIRNIAIAPGNTISLVYPVPGNERVIGLRYETMPEQFKAVQRAMQTGLPVLSGPHKLIQGGEGFILRSPVFTGQGNEPGTFLRYWGVVSIVVSTDALINVSGMGEAKHLAIGLRQGESSVAPKQLIWGRDSVFNPQSVHMDIAVPGGSWQIAAMRKEGWPVARLTTSPLFYTGLLNSILLALLVLIAATRHNRVRGENRQLVREIHEKNRTEEQLRLSQQKYQKIFQLMPDMVGITRVSDGLIKEVNAGFERCTGWTAQEALGRSSIELGLWDIQTRTNAIEQVKTGGYLEDFEFVMITKSGEPRQALMYLTSIRIDDEECLYFMVHDVTPLKQTQAILEKERSNLRTLLTTIPALVWMKDPAGVYLACNSRFERFFGASEAEIVGRTDYDFVDAKLADSFRENDLKAQTAGKPTVNEEWITYADDGHREFLETTKTPVYNSLGELSGVLGIARDITEQHKTEEELRNQRQRFRNLVDSIDGIVWEMDADTFAFTYVSQQAERLLGYPLADWYKPGFWPEHLHPEDRSWVPNFCRQKSNQGEDHDFEYRFLASDGRTVWLHDIVTVVTESGRPRWLRGIMVDTTGRKQEEAEKVKLETQLLQAQKMEAIGRLAGGVAHDFNNKLSVIMGYADMAGRAGKSSSRYSDYLAQITRAANQSRDITRQLLAFSRQEAISPRVIDLNDVVRDSRHGLCRFIGEDIRFDLVLSEQLWMINMDPTQIDQIIMNLAVNARDAMPVGGTLTLSTQNLVIEKLDATEQGDASPGNYVQLTVSDTGCGMDQETIQHIFEPFFTTKEVGKGTGLGLATIYGIVTQNRGFIRVHSNPGIGTTFSILFPRCYDLPNIHKTQEPILQRPHPATILLVEDDDTVREITAELLREIGYHVLVAELPGKAIELCAETQAPIDLLLTDIIMPGMNGKELSEHLGKIRPALQVLFMSGYTADVIDQKKVQTDGLYFIQKPFDLDSLHRKIQSILSQGFLPEQIHSNNGINNPAIYS